MQPAIMVEGRRLGLGGPPLMCTNNRVSVVTLEESNGINTFQLQLQLGSLESKRCLWLKLVSVGSRFASSAPQPASQICYRGGRSQSKMCQKKTRAAILGVNLGKRYHQGF